MPRLLSLCLALFAAVAAMSQDEVLPPLWQQVYEELFPPDDDADDDALQRRQADYDLLEQLASRPLNLNGATREQLEQLPFLSARQVMDLQEYLFRYGPMRSLGELRMVPSLDHQQLRLLPFFVVAEGDDGHGGDPLYTRRAAGDSTRREGAPGRRLTAFSRHVLTATAGIPLYQRRGDRNGYLGYRYRHQLRYEYSSGGNRLRAALVGTQDAGEPFLAGRNGWGYDAYSYYVQLSDMGALRRAVVGKYRLSAGMGLIMGQSFSLGKQAALLNAGRTVQTLRGHASATEADYFQGAAATVAVGRGLSFTPFVSWRPLDATLAADGSATTLITSGYHRTPAEMQKKYNTHQTAAGLSTTYRHQGLQLGLHAIYTRQDRSLEPNRQTLYRRHWPHGTHFANLSLSYAYTRHGLTFNGETATDDHGHLATVNALSLQPSARLTATALYRFYSYRYNTLHGHSFSEGGRVQNESGLYLGATWNPVAHLHVQAYADYARFPWARYLVSQTSHAVDLLAQATYEHRRWTFQGRWRRISGSATTAAPPPWWPTTPAAAASLPPMPTAAAGG